MRAVPVIAAPKTVWLVAAEADLKIDPWLGFRPCGPWCDSASWRTRRTTAADGEATMAAKGRHFITNIGRQAYDLEWLESWC